MSILNSLTKYALGGLLFLTLMLAVAWQVEVRHARKSDQRIVELTELRKSDRASYEAAQIQAEEKNKARVQQIEKQQESINEKARSDYARDLDRLRAQSRTPQGSAGGSKAPGVPQAAPGTPPEVVSLPPAELLRAQELELRLNALIDWVNEQLNVGRSPS